MAKKEPEVYEVLQKVSRARKHETKVSNLQKNASPALRTLLLLNYHPDMKLVKFEPVNHLETETPSSSLHIEYAKLGTLTEGGGKMKGTVEEIRQAYCALLSSVHKEDAENIILSAAGRLSDKYQISLEVVKEAYSELSWE